MFVERFALGLEPQKALSPLSVPFPLLSPFSMSRKKPNVVQNPWSSQGRWRQSSQGQGQVTTRFQLLPPVPVTTTACDHKYCVSFSSCHPRNKSYGETISLPCHRNEVGQNCGNPLFYFRVCWGFFPLMNSVKITAFLLLKGVCHI